MTQFPDGTNDAATWDPSTVYTVGAADGAEQAAKGHEVALAPNVNILRTPYGGQAFACAYGPSAGEAADAFLAAVDSWTRHGRNIPEDAFAYWPAGTTPVPADRGLAGAFPMRGGSTLTVSWPLEPGAACPKIIIPNGPVLRAPEPAASRRRA